MLFATSCSLKPPPNLVVPHVFDDPVSNLPSLRGCAAVNSRAVAQSLAAWQLVVGWRRGCSPASFSYLCDFSQFRPMTCGHMLTRRRLSPSSRGLPSGHALLLGGFPAAQRRHPPWSPPGSFRVVGRVAAAHCVNYTWRVGGGGGGESPKPSEGDRVGRWQLGAGNVGESKVLLASNRLPHKALPGYLGERTARCPDSQYPQLERLRCDFLCTESPVCPSNPIAHPPPHPSLGLPGCLRRPPESVRGQRPSPFNLQQTSSLSGPAHCGPVPAKGAPLP